MNQYTHTIIVGLSLYFVWKIGTTITREVEKVERERTEDYTQYIKIPR